MIGPEYATAAARALLGDTRGGEMPATVWLALLGDGVELSPRVPLDNTDAVWGASGTGVTNVVPIDCGIADVEWVVDEVALFDSESGGSVVVSAPAVVPTTEDPVVVGAGESATIDAGGFVVVVA